MRRRPARRPQSALVAGLLLLAGAGGAAQEPAEVFARFASSVVKVELVEPLTSAPNAVGTAFFVDGWGDGILVTNYHVVTDAVFEPDMRLRLIAPAGQLADSVDVLAADPAHDLAVIRAAGVVRPGLRLTADALPVGTRLFSLGHPLDLQTSVVEGIYNGPVKQSISPRFHFTGSINPGMSGGPTVTSDGRAVGVNVSTAGDQLSFIIPAALLEDLLVEAAQAAAGEGAALTDRLTTRMLEFQHRFFTGFLAGSLPTNRIGRVDVPAGSTGDFDCSAETFEHDDARYDQVAYYCTTFDGISWPGGLQTPFISIEHIYIGSGELNRFQFHSLYTDLFEVVAPWEAPESDEADSWNCRRGNVESGSGSVVRVVFCARRHEKLAGLFDVFVRTALLGGEGNAGVIGTFRVFGVTFENAVLFYRRLLEGYAWTAG